MLSWCGNLKVEMEFVKKVLSDRATFKSFERSCKETDKMLQKSTIFHQALKHDVDSLQVLINFFKSKLQLDELKKSLLATSYNGTTLMHIAASNPDEEVLE